MTINPNKTSYQITLRLCNNGSRSEVKNAPVDIIASVTETLETLIAPKKANQCKAMISPDKKNAAIVFGGNLNFSFRSRIHINTNPVASSILYHTNGIASIEINAPNTAVNPQINTMKCK